MKDSACLSLVMYLIVYDLTGKQILPARHTLSVYELKGSVQQNVQLQPEFKNASLPVRMHSKCSLRSASRSFFLIYPKLRVPEQQVLGNQGKAVVHKNTIFTCFSELWSDDALVWPVWSERPVAEDALSR